MGRNPFKESYIQYLLNCSEAYSERTLEISRRRFRIMDRLVHEEYERGTISTYNPKHLTANDCLQIYNVLRAKDPETQKERQFVTVDKYINDLNNLCKSLDNHCIATMHTRYPNTRKKQVHTRLGYLESDVMELVAETAAGVSDDDFSRLRAYSLVAVYFGAGPRTLEVQHAKAKNVNLEYAVPYIYLDVVKGGETYGESRETPIIQMFLPVIKRYLAAREKYLKEKDLHSEYLFFRLVDGTMLTDKSVRKIRTEVNKDLGISFSGRDCRRSFAQYLKDLGIPIEAISKCMGHSSTKTTERYYARIRSTDALDKMKRFLSY